ncbi:Cell morphogenesis protein PAG1 [Extremus antarcticus]|uniref:Cell morphogenesis protein PAG1 n=1 Tax=Extremus antarcticus TaxID=702011 RepID=A0AAJ0G9R0_9PEZI|nr:Cell morphogenesis protein PAG1 [Extremus antarcticus]
MTAPLPSDGRILVSPTLHFTTSSPSPEPQLVAPTSTSYHARESSSTRGRTLSAASPQNASPRTITSAKQSIDIERKPSVTYGHHRNTSVVNGAVQHSRNPSLLSTTNVSPLSPQKAMAKSAGPDGPTHGPTHGSVASLKKSPSMSTLHSSKVNGSTLSVHGNLERAESQRRVERMHSQRVRRDGEHQRSHSRMQTLPGSESQTVGELALHHMFTSFIAEADERIERCLPKPGRNDPRIESIVGPGADLALDQLLASLGHVSRRDPSTLISSVVAWRKGKGEIVHQKLAEAHALRETHTLTQRPVNATMTVPISPPLAQDIAMLEHNAAIAECRSLTSIYILCRVLIAVLEQTTLKELDRRENTAVRLEEVIYGQLQVADPEQHLQSSYKKANWSIRGQVVGVMSGLRFKEVAGRFLADLEKAQRKLSIKGLNDNRLMSKTALLVQSMRWLKVKSHPEEAWQSSCEMLLVLAKYFAEVHGRVMKHAYAELFEHLLLPIAGTATSELNVPIWREILSIVQLRVTQMLPKADHWPHVFPLQAVLLCVSPPEQFATQWLPLVASFQPKARDRAARSHALKAICRLVWRYLYRHNESQTAVAKKLDEIVKLVFQSGKRVLISTDPVIADPLIQLIRIIGFKHQDLCFRMIIFPLMNSEQLMDSQLKIENLDPEKTVIAIRAFLAIMTDLENGEPPPFPTRFECDVLLDPASRSPITHRRTKSQGFAVSAGRTERLSRPVMTENFNEVSREYYARFCKILGNLTIICDNTFGGQAVLDEKLATHTPKTPMAEAFNFNKRDDLTNPTDLRQNHYDLLHVAVEALPRCFSSQIQINPLVNLLCTGTAHVESHIAKSSAQSLKSIARQSHAQPVTIGFARFIINFDDRYGTVSDGSLLGPGHIENTLQLYVELLQIWIEEIERRTRKAVADPTDEEQIVRPLPLDLSGILAHVDEVESHGLFFLCSPSPIVRAIAVSVLLLVTKFDKALGKPSPRIIDILEGSPDKVISIQDERLTVAERSRLQNGLRRGSVNSTLVELCSSDIGHDANLWMKIFPNLVRLSSEECLHAVALTREVVCQRLSHSHRSVYALGDTSRQAGPIPFDPAFPMGRVSARPINVSSPDIVIEQWRIHLIFACTTLTNIGSSNLQPPKSSMGSVASQHTRKSSKSSSTSGPDKIASATELFERVVRFLSLPNAQVRQAAVDGLGATNVTLFHTLLGSLQAYVADCNTEVKARTLVHQRNAPPPPRNRRTDNLRTEVTRVLSLVCHHLQQQPEDDDYALTYLVDYAKYTRLYLSDAEIQGELDFQKLRTYFCAMTEGIYEYVRKLKEPSRYMSFQSRQATFSLMENWCGFSPNESQIRKHEDHIRRSILERELDLKNRGVMNSAFEKEKSELQLAALSGMATLCSGPLTFTADNRTLMHFDVRRILAWMHMIFETPSDRNHNIGRKALHNLIVHNIDEPSLIAQAMRMCYSSKMPKALASYFEVINRVFTEEGDTPIPYWKVLCAALFILGNEDSEIRMKSARLLRLFEQRQNTASKLQDLDISVSDKTTAVYKLAQFEISRRLAKQHPELAFHVFSEFSAYFKELEPDHQRNMVTAMLPWIQEIHLKLDPAGGLTATTYMLLVNLFEITAKSSITLHNEIQALWQALATGEYGGNVLLVLQFILEICLDKKEQGFIHYAKQIVVFLSQTPAGFRVVDHLLLQIAPRNMANDTSHHVQIPLETNALPYVADIGSVVPGGAKIHSLSLGQLCMTLMVDLVVSPFTLNVTQFVPLLHVVLVQWDNQVGIIQEQARELLVHLLHELVISKIGQERPDVDLKCIENFIESVRRQDPKIAWPYSDGENREAEDKTSLLTEAMAFVIEELLKMFSTAYSGVREEWAKVSMHWAACSNVHVACRSLQVFRCMDTKADRIMLADLIGRLSSTIADLDCRHILRYSQETLTTLRTCVAALTSQELLRSPELFWASCACLESVYEKEFQEALWILNLLLDKLDLSDENVLQILIDAKPAVEGQDAFKSLHELARKGMRSSNSMSAALATMERLVKLPANHVVGRDARLFFTVLANLPRYLHHFEQDVADNTILQSAETLAAAAEGQKLVHLGRALRGFAQSKYRSQDDFLSQCISALVKANTPDQEFPSLVFLMGMANNQCPWFKVKTMQTMCRIMPAMDMRNPEIVSQGPDLISPLLRLLQTEHCQQALDVLDNVIDMTGTPNDSKHLRMSMAGSHSSLATRKEYAHTKSLYGIPEQSGWSVPTPAMYSARARSLLSKLGQNMMVADGTPMTVSTPEFEFHTDDHEAYFTRSVTMMSDTATVDGNMGELANQLDDLDDFFDEQGDTGSPLRTPDLTRHPSTLIEEREALYDQQALPILHKSLKRNTSVTSFQHGLADFRYPQHREPIVMNPGAFAHNEMLPVRPGLHNRSITTPVMALEQGRAHPQNGMSASRESIDGQEPFSDDETSIGRAHTADEPYHMHGLPKPPTTSSKPGWRGVLQRRLTSSSNSKEAKEALKAATSMPLKSPKLPPKVPMTFLSNPTSGEP